MANIISPINVSEENTSSNFFVFPASSSNNRGKLLSEINLRDINGLLTTRNYKIEHTDFQVSLDGTTLQISSGIAVINGYRIVIPETITLGTISNLEVDILYNINLRLSVQNSTSGIVVNEDESENGKVYFDFTPKGNNQTVEDIINTESADGSYFYRDYKPSVNRFSVSDNDVRIEKVGIAEDYSNNYQYEVLPGISNENKFTALNWIANRHHGLFVNALGYDVLNLSALDFNASRNNGNPLFKLTIGYIIKHTDNSYSAYTYDCVKRIDADNIYVGDQTLLEYLASSGSLLKSYGKNIVTSIRENEALGDDSTGNLKEVPYLSTIDAAFTLQNMWMATSEFNADENYYYLNKDNEYICDDSITSQDSFDDALTKYGSLYINTTLDKVYLYVPMTYMGEILEEKYIYTLLEISNETDFNNAVDKYGSLWIKNGTDYEENIGTYDKNIDYYAKVPKIIDGKNIEDLKAVIECSFNSVPNDENNEISDKSLYGSQILSVTSLKDCYTSYGYNIRIRKYENGEYVTESTKLNKHFVGLQNSDSYVKETPENSPPFGLYDDNNTVFIGFKNRYINNTESKDVIYNKADNSVVISTANAVEQSSVDNEYSANTYNVGDLVDYNGAVYYCNVEHTVLSGILNDESKTYRLIKSEDEFNEIKSIPEPGITIYSIAQGSVSTLSPVQNPSSYIADTYYVLTTPVDNCLNYWNIVYFNSGTTFEIDNEKSVFNIYNGGNITSYVGFINENNIAKLILNNGNESSKIYVDGLDSNDRPIIKFEDNLNVLGYVRANRVYDAVYNDYAEWYNSSEAHLIEEGDIIYYNPQKDEYTNHSDKAKRVVGICSEDYGFIVGGNELKDMSENRKDHIPVSLCGRVKVKINPNCDFECGDYVYANGTNIGTDNGNSNEIVGKFIKYTDKKDYAIVQVQLS